MDPEGDAPPPFWFQPPPAALLRQRRRSSSPPFNPVAIIILVPILALFFVAFVFIPLVSNASQLLKTPNSLKKGWDSLNVVLVLFAILCGVFLRQNNDDASVSSAVETMNGRVTESVSASSEWLDDFSDENNAAERVRESGAGKMMRSSSSYPDLRQEETLWQAGNRQQYRFYDDFDLNIYNRSPLEFSRPSGVETDDSDIKVIPVDTFVSRSNPSPAITLAAPPASSESLTEPQQPHEQAPQHQPPKEDEPPQPPQEAPLRQQPKEDQPRQEEALLQQPRPVKLKRRRSVRNSAKKETIKRRTESNHLDKTDTGSLPSSPPSAAAAHPPPPPPPPPIERRQEKSEMLERKKSGATKEIATAIASLYNRTKKKKKHKIRNIHDDATAPTSPPPTKSSIPPSTPPPPPPPPPPSVFHNMFKKGIKSKKIHSESPSVKSPPPPPPPPNSIFNNIFKNTSKSKRFNSASIPTPPPPPPPPQSSILNIFSKPSSTSKRFISTSSSPPLPPQSQSRRRKPPLPTKTRNYDDNIGSQSPVMHIPPPPPPPPFKMQQVKFEARGDFVRIKSAHGSRSSSPELEDVEVASTTETPRAVDGGAKADSSVFCPSPDVNTKADNFIARLRDEWRLEKMNSIRASQ